MSENRTLGQQMRDLAGKMDELVADRDLWKADYADACKSREKVRVDLAQLIANTNAEHPLTPVLKLYEWKLIAALLDLAGERFGNHGCTDFDLREHGLDAAQCKEIVTAIAEDNGDELELEDITEPGHCFDDSNDWVLMHWLAKRIRKGLHPLTERVQVVTPYEQRSVADLIKSDPETVRRMLAGVPT